MSTPSWLSAMFTKGNNFRDILFASLNEVYSSRKKIAPTEKGGQNENGKIASPESVPILF